MSDLSDAPETPEMEVTDVASAPAWFDAEKHRAGEGGIFERATGVLLGEDGEPFSAAARLSRAEAAAAEAAAAEAGAGAGEAAKPAKKPRGTVNVLADHINAGAAAGEQE